MTSAFFIDFHFRILSVCNSLKCEQNTDCGYLFSKGTFWYQTCLAFLKLFDNKNKKIISFSSFNVVDSSSKFALCYFSSTFEFQQQVLQLYDLLDLQS